MSAGSVLFRREDKVGKLQICLIHQLDRDEWLLPKGRKDCGESIEAAAVRETYEETGYACELVPLRMPTRVTVAGEDHTDEPVLRDAVLEPMSIVLQDRGGKGAKVIWWFVARIKDGASKVHGTQMATENYESHFLEAEQAISRLSFQGYRDIAQQAFDLVKSTEEGLQRPII